MLDSGRIIADIGARATKTARAQPPDDTSAQVSRDAINLDRVNDHVTDGGP
jgi:hypothetical protein